MTDLQVFPEQPAPAVEVPIADGFAALAAEAPVTDAAPPARLVKSPVPAPMQQTFTPAEVVDGWYTDPGQAGLAAGLVESYARQSPEGLAAARRDFQTVDRLATDGKFPSSGDTAELGTLWAKFKSRPGSLDDEQSTKLLDHIRQIGSATSESPDLRFDPVGRVTSVGARGEVRVAYPAKPTVADLDLRPLAPAGVENLRRLAKIGAGATGTVPTSDVLPAFLGFDPKDRPSKQALAELDGVVALLAEENGTDPAAIKAAVAAGWNQLAGRSEPWQEPWTLGTTNEALASLEDRLTPHMIDALKGGVAALDFTLQGDIGIMATPDGGLAVSAQPTAKNAKLLRNLYPAFSKGGVTAWLPGAPAKTEDVNQLRGDIDLIPESAYASLGGHPLFVPGEHVTFDVQPGFDPGPLTAQDVGPVVSSRTTLKTDRLGAGDIDPERLEETLKSHAWALIPASNSTRVALQQKGFKPIKHTANGDQLLVFGISPSEARRFTDGEIVTNAGTYSSDGFRPGSGISTDRAADGLPSTSHLFDRDVHWLLDGVDRNADPEDDSGELERSRVRSRRVVVSVPEGQLEHVLARASASGAENVRLYGHRADVPGFKTAWETIYSDGVSYGSVLATTPGVGSASGPVLVPASAHISDHVTQNPSDRRTSLGLRLNGVSVITTEDVDSITKLSAPFLRADGDAIVPAEDMGDAQLKGGKIVVNDPTPAAAKLIELARRAGVPDDKIRAPLPEKIDFRDQGQAVTISGQKVGAIKRTRPSADWAERYGIEFDPAWRDGSGIRELEPATATSMSDTYGRFLDSFGEAADMWGLSRIAVTTGYHATPAYTEWGRLGGAIGLSATQWSDPGKLRATLADYQKHNVTVPNTTDDPSYFVAHELGHVVHGSLQFGSDASGARAELLKLRLRHGVEGIRSGLSQTAWLSPEEMVAEAVAEHLSGSPRPLARDVVAIVSSAVGRVRKARGKAAWR